MGRPSLTDNDVYVETQKRLEPVRKIVDDARAECALIMRRAEARVDDETMAALWYGVDRGLSQYAVGKLMGKTRAEHQRELFDRVKRWGGANPDSDLPAAGTEMCEGWTWGPQVVGGWTAYVSPEGERYMVGFNTEQYVEWHKPDGSVMSFAERDELPRDVEVFAQEKMENA
jgi:hypothetical protein